MRIGTDGSSTAAAVYSGQLGVASADKAEGVQAFGSPRTKGFQAADTKDSKGKQGTGDQVELSPDAQKEIARLKATDQEVRAHEAAHMAAGGGIVRGGATYSFQQGPDGKRYAVGGEVSIDSSPVRNNPRATEAKARQIQAAAMAPANPSPQDRKVAAQAAQMAADAASELASNSTKDEKERPALGGKLNLVA